jgi:uncharacterized protein YbgA (DUF1722 family)
MRPRIGISDSLLHAEGDGPCFLTDLGRYVEWVPFGADTETVLGALWETWRLTGQDCHVTPSADDASSTPASLDGYVTRAQPAGPPAVPWTGGALFAGRLAAAHPMLTITDEETLRTWMGRARFVERVFAAARLRALFAGRWRRRDLVAFHTRHKLQILAHDPTLYREAGRVVARVGSRPPEETEADYRRIFGAALSSDVTRGRNVNALQHAVGHFGRELDGAVRHTVVERIRAYERGELPFNEPLVLLARHAGAGQDGWIADQTYLDPCPADLRHHLWDPPIAR